MKPDDYQKAKAIFMKHKCNYFFIAREEDGVYDEYTAYNVPKDIEDRWVEEYRDGLFGQLVVEKNQHKIAGLFYNICNTIGIYCPTPRPLELLTEFLMKSKPLLDSFTLILLSESLLRGVKSYRKNASLDKTAGDRAKEAALGTLCELLESPLTVSEDHDYMRKTYDFSEENMRDRISLDILHWEDSQW